MDYSRFTPYKPWLLAVVIGTIVGALLTDQPWIGFGVVTFYVIFGLVSAIR